MGAATQEYDEFEPELLPDGSGGVFVSYVVNISVNHLWVQRLDALSQAMWGVGSDVGWNSGWGRMVSDGADGLIIGLDNCGTNYWHSESNVRAKRVSPGGLRLWGTHGVPICSAAGSQRRTQVVADGGGGAFLTWQDDRDGQTVDIYAQRVHGTGAVAWAADGIALSTAAGDQENPALVRSGVGGIFIAWQDARMNATTAPGLRISRVPRLGSRASSKGGSGPRGTARA